MRSRIWLHRGMPFAVAAILVGIITTVATGVVSNSADPRDVRGALDVRSIGYGWATGTAPSWQVRTYGRFSARLLWDRGYLFVEFDTRGDTRTDFYIMVYSDGRRIRGELFEVGRNRDRRIRSVGVGRPDRATVVVRMAWSNLEFAGRRDTFTWWVTTTFSGDVCRRVCVDVAPNTGVMTEWRPGASPSPTTTTTTTTTTTATTTTSPPPT